MSPRKLAVVHGSDNHLFLSAHSFCPATLVILPGQTCLAWSYQKLHIAIRIAIVFACVSQRSSVCIPSTVRTRLKRSLVPADPSIFRRALVIPGIDSLGSDSVKAP